MTCCCYPASILGCTPTANPDCVEHGRDSDWWKSPEQVARRQAELERLLGIQTRARHARSRSRNR